MKALGIVVPFLVCAFYKYSKCPRRFSMHILYFRERVLYKLVKKYLCYTYGYDKKKLERK